MRGWLARFELGLRVGAYAGAHGWTPTRRRCTKGDRIYVNRDGIERCTNQLVEKMLADAGGTIYLRLVRMNVEVKE